MGVLTLAALAPATSSASRRPPADTGATPDPWEKFNRGVFGFNRRIDRAILVPLSRLTSGLTPGPVGRAIHNFVVNLHEPVVIVNDLLQAKPAPAVKSAFRLVVNTIAGGLGAVDVAKALGASAHKNGFGDTLGRWGAQPGPYVVIPVLGPATIRDLLGSIVDDVTVPLQFVDFPYRTEVDITVSVVGGLNERAQLGPQYEALLAGAADPYATLRSSYLQARDAQIRGEKALPPLPEIEDVTPPPPIASPPQASPAQPPSPPSGVLPPEGGEKGQTGASPPPQGEVEPEVVEGAASAEASPEETRL
jgi:phospholipid-binding lipoprotein MlaA